MPIWVNTTLGLVMPAAVGVPFGGSTPAAEASTGTPPLITPFIFGKSATSSLATHLVEQGPVIAQHLAYPTEHVCTMGETTLADEVDAGLGRLTVNSSADFPAPVFRVKIEDEIITVYAAVGNVWFVDRGSDGTKAASHTATTLIAALITADSLGRMVLTRGVRNVPASQIPAVIPANTLYVAQEGGLALASGFGFGPWFGLTTPHLQRFSWTNQGPYAMAQQVGQTIYMTSGADPTSFSCRVLDQPYTPGTTVTLGIIPTIWNSTQYAGMILTDSVSGKCITWGNMYGNMLYGANQNSVTSANGAFCATTVYTNGIPLFFRYRNDGRYRYFGISYDNVFYWEDPTVCVRAYNEWIVPNRIGFFTNNYGLSYPFCASVIHWSNGN